ncbi:DUF5333 domain-containing protein [Pseudooceanicola onchidii]|uniref:DUF5333 domain-containing protein n=1 Tax=Pseudooceanicola onchidii TaxID=2562279 RepID=UPI0010AB43B3|nr:DUF5333 domain-containing protein [Pseudooceanicola onchidii]
MRLTTTAPMLGLILALGATAATAKVPLRDVPEIDNQMFSVAMAIEISDKCDSISPRTLKGLNFLFGLASQAKGMGYTKAEIDAYRKSDAEKARIRAKGEAYVREKGLDPAKPADLCKLGQMEMAANSQIGSFLK